MASGEWIPDEALVVRCGQPPFPASPLLLACGEHPEGVHGFSVQSAAGLTVGQLAVACRNKTVGFSIVGDIRGLGYDVIRTGREFHHATVAVPRDWSEDAAKVLADLFQLATNLAPRGRS